MACRSCCYVINNHLIEGGGGVCTFQKQIFLCRNFSQIFFIHQWPLSLTVKGGIKNIPSYTGGGWGCPIQQNFFQESKRRCKGYFVVDHLILRGGADKKCRGRLFISSMGQGQERFQISLYEKHRVALLTSDQKHVRVQYRLGMQNTPSCPVAWIPSIAGQICCLD